MIYLDYNATTPVLPEVLETMVPYLTSEWGNPSSSYKFGSKLKTVIETARAQVAELIGAHAMEIIFTSCATESNNAAIHAALKANPGKRHIVTSTVEHSSVLNYCMALEKEGYRVTYLPVDREGLLKIADLENAITVDTAMGSDPFWPESREVRSVSTVPSSSYLSPAPSHKFISWKIGQPPLHVRVCQQFVHFANLSFARISWKASPFCQVSRRFFL
jgi:glutamate/tyrosine decarboxylase-like PLP-dependent enzyme